MNPFRLFLCFLDMHIWEPNIIPGARFYAHICIYCKEQRILKWDIARQIDKARREEGF